MSMLLVDAETLNKLIASGKEVSINIVEELKEEQKIEQSKVKVLKKSFGFSISTDLMEEYNNICKGNNFNKSAIIEDFIRMFVQQHKK